MSETQIKVTGSFHAVDSNGNKYIVEEYTLYRHTTDAEIKFGEGTDKMYKLGNGTNLRRINETEFEIESTGTRIQIAPN